MNRIINKLKRVMTELKWKIDANKCKKKIRQKTILSEINNNNLWIIMPHSDDEWIGCSQLLSTKPEAIHVLNMNMTGGDDEEIHTIREKEISDMADKFRYRVTLVDSINYLCSLLIKEQPEVVFLPSFLDWHPEHHQVIELFVEAAGKTGYSGEICMYQISVPLPIKLINAGKMMSKEALIKKWDLFCQVYKTQRFLPQKRFQLNEMINGAISGSYALEAYSIMSFEEWISLKEKCSLDKLEIEKIRNRINDIKTIRELIENKVKC